MSEIRRGSAAIREAAKSSGGGEFKPFLRSIYWKDDGEEHFVLFLNDVEDLPLFDMIQFIPDGDFFQEVVAKTSPPFSEKSDQFEKVWDATPAERNIAIAVELEPVTEVTQSKGKTRRKPRGFEVKTVEYERRIFDENDEATGETEEVIAPCVGYISQSPNNFFNQIANYNDAEAPVTETALKITRIGKDKNTTYQVVGYDEIPIDLSNLVAYIDGVSYLNDDIEGLLDEIENLETDEAAAVIGKVLLEKREQELLDGERYEELFESVTESMDKFGRKKKKAEKKEPVKGRRRSARESSDEPNEPASDPAPTEEVEPKAKAKGKAKAAKQTPQDRMKELRERAAKAAAARK